MSQLGLRRLMKEYKRLQERPVDSILAKPEEGNFFKWHFALHSLQHEDYAGGVYIGLITFPSEYPMKPPDILFLTPNGRFATNKKICLSFTSFHPESWDPSWTFENMMVGLISFMLGEDPATGTVQSSSSSRRQLAAQSVEFNKKIADVWSHFEKDLEKLPVPVASPEARPGTDGHAPALPTPAFFSSSWLLALLLFLAAVILKSIL